MDYCSHLGKIYPQPQHFPMGSTSNVLILLRKSSRRRRTYNSCISKTVVCGQAQTSCLYHLTPQYSPSVCSTVPTPTMLYLLRRNDIATKFFTFIPQSSLRKKHSSYRRVHRVIRRSSLRLKYETILHQFLHLRFACAPSYNDWHMARHQLCN